VRARIAALLAAALALAGCAGPRTQAATIGAGLGGADGLRATRYAAGLANVSALALDAQGRLWAATAAYTDQGADGLYVVAAPGAAPVEVVAGLRTPLGLAWLDGWLYVASLGRVDAFAGFDGTRFAERRAVLDGPVAGGENNGLVVTPDGRLLMGISAPCDHCVPPSPWSASIVSFLPDGSDLRLYASRIRAPFGLAVDPGTGGVLATMNQRDDLGERTPGDWLALVREGQDWGFPGCYGQGGPACAGVPGPLAVLDRHAAAGGVAVSGGAAIVAEWATGRVLRVSLGADGGRVSSFVTGMRNPLPVLAARGAVLVGDWGTGRVYRISA
jgi:glucose/arabinose dehydrogenase